MEKPLKQLSTQEWEVLIDDFQSGAPRRERWLSQYSGLALLEVSLSSILRKDFPLKLQLIVFLEEFADVLIREFEVEEALGRLIEALRAVVQAPMDGISVTYSLKEQMMISVTSVVITIDGFKSAIRHVESLTELLLTVINRPNHGLDRQTRAIACVCLRELERNYPCLLAEIAGHLWSLCQSERTHASQSYILLLTSVIHDLVISKTNVSILTTSVPLVPFNVPHSLLATGEAGSSSGLNKELSVSNIRELRKVMAFLLERPQILTPCGMIEFMSMLMRVAVALELQASLLKVQFSGLLYSYDPILCHVVLMLYSRFSDAFDGQEAEIARRLMLISREVQHHLVFRLLAIHWLLGFVGLTQRRELTKKNPIFNMVLSFYPTVFDPLALKALKLDILAYCAICLDLSRTENPSGVLSEEVNTEVSVVKLFEDGHVSVSAFKWLPPWSTETAVAFRTFHKFLIGATPHSICDSSTIRVLMESTIFHRLQRMLVNMALEFRRLVPVIVAFIDRLLGCHSHCWLGERLLQTFDEHMLPKVIKDYQLASYFPIFNRIAENDTIPPHGLLELLTSFVVALVEKHGPDTGMKSWSLGSKVLGICRTMLMHHNSSRVFFTLTHLLAFTCLYFPDLEIRDNARIYLRMLVCIPGKKLRDILNLGEQLPSISPSQPGSSFLHAEFPQPYDDLRKSRNLSSYIYLERVIPLLVKQSWSLSLPTFSVGDEGTSYLEGIGDSEAPVDVETEPEGSSDVQIVSNTERNRQSPEPLRVMDTKVSEILVILRRHFSCIPDFRHMPGIKIRIPCIIRFEAEPFNRIWGLPATNLDGVDALAMPAIYATVLTFSSSSPYGSIPSCHIPFLLGESLRKDHTSEKRDCLDIVLVENESQSQEEENFRVPVVVELEPREPMPGLVDVSIEANAESGQIIHGHLQSISVGIEDMFLKANVPSDIPEDEVPCYYSDLFVALWEACGNSSNIGRETFPLRGGKCSAAISGTQSVKLLEVPSGSLIPAVERHLAPFIVSVTGRPLINRMKDGGVIGDIIWKDETLDSVLDTTSATDFNGGPLQLEYVGESGRENHFSISKRDMGHILILIFLPPRFHLLFQMEVCDISTLVRIRTDHWPCLAYIDEYLEALFFT
ncbi:PREDICTED: uncharacterized protein LOC104592558 [Nelumbo nucifera]|uniref:Uncharacterized protein LOC104592558 n=2 Tax=Nelumbo nucifera TaxID=4432 RepID=A0A1U7Z9Z4_NELNU|nr:PREDICTED: uncharacterized protein LOC104592558 [Nelumbo nucifera]DAD36022.1 TPA_asm: hypothetical protein HUJ06_006662 [Nelumbo nucifera]